MKTILLVAALASAAALSSVSAADLTGKVTLKGTPPAEQSVEAKCGDAMTKIATRHYVVGAGGGLANVFVYLKEGVTKKGGTPAVANPILDQQNCEYQPYVLGVMAGQKFTVRNSDPLMHNVHPLPVNNAGFNIAQTTKGQETVKSFDKPEVFVKVKCDVHGWMFAYIGVVDHPYFAITDKDGSFKIPNVPPGDYTVEAVHLKAGAATQKVKVTDGDQKPLDFTLEVKAKP